MPGSSPGMTEYGAYSENSPHVIAGLDPAIQGRLRLRKLVRHTEKVCTFHLVMPGLDPGIHGPFVWRYCSHPEKVCYEAEIGRRMARFLAFLYVLWGP
jgi:hypothetical protein